MNSRAGVKKKIGEMNMRSIKKRLRMEDREKMNWFTANPKKTIFMALAVFCLLVLILAENILKYKNKVSGIQSRGIERYIVLRENSPSTSTFRAPEDVYLRDTDSLIKKKYRIAIDSNGFMEPSERHVNPDKKIVFLGGSTTECKWMEEESRFPYLAGLLLEKETGLKINSYNGGVSGNNSLHSIDALINKVIPLKPDAVVFMHNINEITALLYEKDYWKSTRRPPVIEIPRPSLLKLAKQFISHFIPNLSGAATNLLAVFERKYSAGEDEFVELRGKRLEIDMVGIKDAFALNLQTFINICKARRITPVLMTQENRFTEVPDSLILRTVANKLKNDFAIEYKDYKALYDMLNQVTRDAAKKEGLLLIDLDREIPHTNQYLYDPVHFNDVGSKLAAEIISRKLLPVVRP